MAKCRFLMLIIFLVTLFSGCQSQSKALNERFIVGGIGIDVRQENFTVLLLGLNAATDDPSGEESILYLQGEGATLHKALSDAAAGTDKKLYFGHCGFVMLGAGEALRRAGELSESLLAAGILRSDTSLLLCETGASTVLRRPVSSEYGVCGGVDQLLNDNSFGRDLRVPLYAVVHAAKTGSACFLPYITAVETEETTPKGEPYYVLSGKRLCVFGPEETPLFLTVEESDTVLLLSGRLSVVEMQLPDTENHGVFRLDSPIVGISSARDGSVNVQVVASLRTKTAADPKDAKTVSALMLDDRIHAVLEKVLMQHNCDLWGITKQSNSAESVSINDLRSADIRTEISILINT